MQMCNKRELCLVLLQSMRTVVYVYIGNYQRHACSFILNPKSIHNNWETTTTMTTKHPFIVDHSSLFTEAGKKFLRPFCQRLMHTGPTFFIVTTS